MEKILSLSIAAYNAEKDIVNCLDSLIRSNVLEKLDIIVVNDGSKDHTAEVVQKYVERYRDSIRLVNKKNGGHGSTINTSIKYACGKYYKILDADDWVNSENLNRLVAFLEKTDYNSSIVEARGLSPAFIAQIRPPAGQAPRKGVWQYGIYLYQFVSPGCL